MKPSPKMSKQHVRSTAANQSLSDITPRAITGGALAGAMGRTEIASFSPTSHMYDRACDTTQKLNNIAGRLEILHTALFGGMLQDGDSCSKDIGASGFFGLLDEETQKHPDILSDIDSILRSLEHRTGLTNVDRAEFQVIELPEPGTATNG